MYDLIKEIFESYGYVCQEFEHKLLFSKTVEDSKKDFWLLVQLDSMDDLIENQVKWLEQCKRLNNAQELEKNISMLVLWSTGGAQEFSEMKKKIMPIEEDPYFFKKHVLYFSISELEKLIEVVGEENLVEFVKEKIPLNNTFSSFKNDPQGQTWQSLLYRIAIKLPFIDIQINDEENLESLFEKNNENIEEHVDNLLSVLNNKIFELYDEISLNDLKNKDISDLLEDLTPVLSEGNTDED